MRNHGRLVFSGLLVAASLLVATGADAVPEGFQREYLYSPGTETNNLVFPTNLEFAPDSQRIFITEKRGVIKTASSPGAPLSIVADMRPVTHSFWDRGMLGLAVHPDYPDTPYIYVLYAHGIPLDIAEGPSAEWEAGAGVDNDPCSSPPGSTADGCVVSAQLARITVDESDLPVDPDDIEVLIHDWCQQFPSHSVGDLVFGVDDALYVSAGDGASFGPPDWGWMGGTQPGTPTPKNPCGDPPDGVGGEMDPSTAEGGALRSQDLRTNGDPVSADGAILRINPLADPDNSATLVPSGNPNASHPDQIGKLIVAHGLRNPYRMTVRPGTSQIYIGDVGYNTWEEVNRILSPTAGILNFGWPCYEGGSGSSLIQPGYAPVGMCEDLIQQGAGAVAAPFFAYRHTEDIQHPNNDECPPAETGQDSRTSSSTTGLAFYSGGTYPSQYNGALFGADYSRNCIWVMRAGQNGQPDPTTVQVFHFEPKVGAVDGITPVDLEMGQDGRIYGVSHLKGHIFRFNWTGANDAPVANIEIRGTANPLERILDGTGSSDPEGKALTYAWDTDNDGLYDDAFQAVVTREFAPGPHRVGLRITDLDGASATASTLFQVANTVPTAAINSPTSSFKWTVGEDIQFSGTGSDAEDGVLPPEQMHWALILHHCGEDETCHEHHDLGSATGQSGAFTAPDHEYPSWLELRLTVEDHYGPDSSATASVVIHPKTVNVTIDSEPAGVDIGLGRTPYTNEVIVNSLLSLSAPETVQRCGRTLSFSHWGHGGDRVQNLNAPSASTTYTAVYTPSTACDGIGLADRLTGKWYLRDPLTEQTTSFYYGNPGDIPFMGDWDCDGVTTPGLYRQSDGFVYLRNSNTQGIADIRFFFGNPGDVPIAGDFNGDGCDTVSIYRPSEARFYIINKLGQNDGGLGAAEFSYIFGNPGDKPFVGDFDGNGVDTIGLHRESTGLVYYRNTHTQGIADAQFIYGNPGDRLVAGKWAEAGNTSIDTVGVFRPSNGVIYLKFSNTQGVADVSFPYGSSAMWPVAGNFGDLPGGSAPPG